MRRKIWHFSKRTTIWLYRFFEAFVALFLVLFSITFWKLYTEPMDAKFLLPALAKELLPKDSGYMLEVESAELSAEFKEDGLFHLNMRDLQLVRPDKTVAIDLPVVELSYGLWHIVTLNYMPDKLIVERPDIRVVIDPEGNWRFQKEGDALPDVKKDKAGKQPITVRQLLKHLLSFHDLAIINGVVSVEDLEKKEKLSLPRFDFYLHRRYGGLNHVARMSAVAQISDHLTDIKVHTSYGRLTQNLTVEAGITPIYVNKFGRFMPLLEGIDLPISVSFAADFNTRQKYKNFLECLEKLKFQVKALSEGTVTLPSPIAAVYPVASAEINGAVSAGFKTVKIAQSSVALAKDITADVEVTVKGMDKFLRHSKLEDIQTTLLAHVYNVPMAEVPNVWPSEQGPDAHAWVVQHLSKGRVPQADFNLTFVGDEMTDVFGDVQTEGVRVDYLPDMPALENVSARVLLYPNKVEIIGEKGAAGNVQLMDAALLFAPLDAEVTDLNIQLGLSGPIAEMLQAINKKPLELLEGIHFDWNQIKGDAETRIQLKFPLDEETLQQNLQVEVQADTKNAGVVLTKPQLTLDKGNLNLFVNNEALSLEGTVAFKDQPLSVSWHEDFSSEDNAGTSLEVKGSVAMETMTHLIDDVEKYAVGPVFFDVMLKRPTGQKQWSGIIQADATKAKVELYPFAVTKEADSATQVTAVISEALLDFSKGEGSFNLDGKAQKQPLVVQGQVTWGNDWAIQLDKVQAIGNDFKALLDVRHDMLKLNVQGDKWNLSKLKDMPLFKDTSESKEKTIWAQHMLLEAQLNSLTLNANRPIEKVLINAERKNKVWKYFQLEAVADEPFLVVYNPEKRLFEGMAPDFGKLMSYLNISDKFIGGHLKLQANQTEAGLIQGKILTDKTEIADPGFLIQALSILGIVDAIRGKNMVFDEIHVPFELNPEGDLKVDDGYAAGSNLGVTFKGTVNLDNVDIAGSVIPAYLVNSLPGKIPLIGALFREGEGGGLLGVKYSVTGKPTKTEVEFHPLSSIVPGALGYIF